MNKAVILAAFLMLISGVPTIAQTSLPNMTVVSIGDGDTLRVRNQQGQAITIRLACVDAPELKQTPWGQQSRTRLGQLLPLGQSVQVRSIESDKYKRLVAEVFVSNRSVNLTMVQEGQAVLYRQYLKGCDRTKDQFLQAEANAKQQKVGFWNQSQPVMPWDFRRGKKNTAPTIERSQQQQCDRSYPDFCIPPNAADLDCPDIPYRRFRVNQPDPHGFDRDRDGIGCES
ncbi:SNase-like nuclease (plasmid) [Trichormus variabilis ATCC 29413]|uniref:SNase-like nuclease n=2 Tax=Anabaena variabilis TaxID=264691 RepID=Q3M1Y5_TRIV2|nr:MULTISPECIES: thermonuclease family protein [Nostocaceae]ABA25001.1 SNase-like nuclease [Trichormus variabilis ATCC 29413]MBC1217773.1 thermonuclease family protein [Trichormus variabilis ARAD]MBC1259307.1 thermonuclease family protein [Trichormus variabilis V5]MBC1270712.1 thermonuclease family protein [Trichormus variabilis FSR]MBC1305561.1 thermonuclease family protein [Trichormus variabilis N2B]